MSARNQDTISTEKQFKDIRSFRNDDWLLPDGTNETHLYFFYYFHKLDTFTDTKKEDYIVQKMST